METLLKELTLYDVMAYLLPGFVLLWAILKAADSIRGHATRQWTWKLIVVAYIVGHLLQASVSPARLWSREPVYLQTIDSIFPDIPGTGSTPAVSRAAFRSDLASMIVKTFNDPPSSEWFYLCESYLQEKKLDGFIQIMQARHGFFRGLSASLGLAALALLVAAGVQARIRADPYRREWIESAIVALLCVAGAYLAAQRTDDFGRYYAEGTYRAFYVDHLSSGAQPASSK
jgi:hypothetical protein